MFTYDAFQKANNKDADQTVQMRGLVSPVLFAKLRRQVFSQLGPNEGHIKSNEFVTGVKQRRGRTDQQNRHRRHGDTVHVK